RPLPVEQREKLRLDRSLVPLVDLGRAPDGTRSVLVAVAEPYASTEYRVPSTGDSSLDAGTASTEDHQPASTNSQLGNWYSVLGTRLQPLIVPRGALKLAADLGEAGPELRSRERLEEFLRYLVQRRYLRPERMPVVLKGVLSGEQPLDKLLLEELPDSAT